MYPFILLVINESALEFSFAPGPLVSEPCSILALEFDELLLITPHGRRSVQKLPAVLICLHGLPFVNLCSPVGQLLKGCQETLPVAGKLMDVSACICRQVIRPPCSLQSFLMLDLSPVKAHMRRKLGDRCVRQVFGKCAEVRAGLADCLACMRSGNQLP